MSHDWRVSLSAFQCLNFKSGNWKEGYFLTTNSIIFYNNFHIYLFIFLHVKAQIIQVFSPNSTLTFF